MLSSSRSRCSNSNSRGYVQILNQPEQTSIYLRPVVTMITEFAIFATSLQDYNASKRESKATLQEWGTNLRPWRPSYVCM